MILHSLSDIWMSVLLGVTGNIESTRVAWSEIDTSGPDLVNLHCVMRTSSALIFGLRASTSITNGMGWGGRISHFLFLNHHGAFSPEATHGDQSLCTQGAETWRQQIKQSADIDADAERTQAVSGDAVRTRRIKSSRERIKQCKSQYAGEDQLKVTRGWFVQTIKWRPTSIEAKKSTLLSKAKSWTDSKIKTAVRQSHSGWNQHIARNQS